MAKITQVNRLSVSKIFKAKAKYAKKIAQERAQAEALKAQMEADARFDSFLKSTAKDMLKGSFSKTELHVGTSGVTQNISTSLLKEDSIWALWSNVFRR